MQLFYAPHILTNNYLDKENSNHCVKVLRKKNGDKIDIIDGVGNFYVAQIVDNHPKKCLVNILESKKETPTHDGYIHIAIAPTKNTNRIEWFVEKAIEIGINEISFIKTENSERKELNLERIEKIAISAIKQALKATLPRLNPLASLQDFIQRPFEGNKFLAHLAETPKPLVKQKVCSITTVLIGPEGDFSGNELKLIQDKGFTIVSLGNSRLRTETAGVVACTLLVNK